MAVNIEDANIFMMCSRLNRSAIVKLPTGYHIRNIREDELDLWKRISFDDEQTADKYHGFMTDWYDRVYAPKKELFLGRCLLVCDKDDQPVGTCFLWEAYGVVPTIHWFKVKKEYEGKGIGRALLSVVMEGVTNYPVYLHTQAGSFRAIKLYSDFGFALLRDPVIGNRRNETEQALPYLKEHMPESDYNNLRFEYAGEDFLRIVSEQNENDF